MWLVTSVAALLLIGSGEVAGQCACATAIVNVRSGAGTNHNVLGTLNPNQCAPYKGNQAQGGGYTWAHIDYNGHDGWAATNWLHIGACGGSSSSGGSHGQHSDIQLAGCPRIITRSEWNARPPTVHIGNMPGTPKYVFIHHGTGPFCHSQSECAGIVRSYQNYHIDTHHWPDIGYNFVVGEDGHAYEARGWTEIGAHTLNYNSVGIAICVIGDFTHRVPNDAALNTVKQLIQCALDNHKIIPTYHLLGHRDVGTTACPGQMLWELIHHWPHYGK